MSPGKPFLPMGPVSPGNPFLPGGPVSPGNPFLPGGPSGPGLPVGHHPCEVTKWNTQNSCGGS